MSSRVDACVGSYWGLPDAETCRTEYLLGLLPEKWAEYLGNLNDKIAFYKDSMDRMETIKGTWKENQDE